MQRGPLLTQSKPGLLRLSHGSIQHSEEAHEYISHKGRRGRQDHTGLLVLCLGVPSWPGCNMCIMVV